MRKDNRQTNQLRPISITRDYLSHAEGSVLISSGETKVLCAASVVPKVPPFLKGKGQGWITAEYSMLPRATHDRSDREVMRGRQSGRTMEIQRLIGRSLRSSVDLKLLGENTITIDCDVIQADGGTRTTAITGGCIALLDAIRWMQRQKLIKTDPVKYVVAAISVGIVNNEPMIDLDYAEDSGADMDMNVVMNDKGEYIEVQGTAEGRCCQKGELDVLLTLASSGLESLFGQIDSF